MHNEFKDLLIQRHELLDSVAVDAWQTDQMLEMLLRFEQEQMMAHRMTGAQVWHKVHTALQVEEEPNLVAIFLSGLCTLREGRGSSYESIFVNGDAVLYMVILGLPTPEQIKKLSDTLFKRPKLTFFDLTLLQGLLGWHAPTIREALSQQAEGREDFLNKFSTKGMARLLGVLVAVKYDSESFWMLRTLRDMPRFIIAEGLSCNGNNLDKACEIFQEDRHFHPQFLLCLNPHLLSALEAHGIIRKVR
jgi:hypothetical protein